MRCPKIPCPVSIALAVAILACVSARSAPAAIVGLGADYASGPVRQSTRDVLGFVMAKVVGADLTLTAGRFDHSDLGSGTIGSVGLGVPLSPTTTIQTTVARTNGDETYRAWFFQAGPVFAIGGERTLGFLYTRAGNNITSGSTGLASELGLPLSPSFSVLGRGTVASVEGGGTSLQGSVGMIWGFARRLALLAELGAGRDVTALAQGAGTSQLEPGILGASAQDPFGRGYVSGSAFQIGMRYIIH